MAAKKKKAKSECPRRQTLYDRSLNKLANKCKWGMVRTERPNPPPSHDCIHQWRFWRNNPPDIWAGQPTKWILERRCGNVNYNWICISCKCGHSHKSQLSMGFFEEFSQSVRWWWINRCLMGPRIDVLLTAELYGWRWWQGLDFVDSCD